MKRKVLYIQHAYFNRAGTEAHSKLLAVKLNQKQQSIFLTWDTNKIALIENDSILKSWKIPELDFPVTPLTNETYEFILKEVLTSVNPNVVHVHHFHHWPFSVMNILNKYTIPWVFTVHDYYLITPHFTMQGIMDPRVTLGPNYSKTVFGSDISSYLIERRNFILENINGAKNIIAPSNYAKNIFESVFQISVQVIEHGIEKFEPIETHVNGFGFIGSFLPQKGFQSLLQGYIRYKEKGGTFKLHLFGGQIEERIEGVIQHGVYDYKDLPSIGTLFSVGIIPSVFPETFCLTLSELWMMKKPVISARIGALTERIQRGNWGILYNAADVTQLSDAMIMVENQIQSGSFNISTPKVKTAEEMAAEYDHLYDEVIRKNSSSNSSLR